MNRVNKEDSRTVKSAEKVLQALFRCLEQKEFDSISFTDLHKESGVGRSTIYRLFDNTLDVLDYGCDGLASRLNRRYMELITRDTLTKRDYTRFIFESWKEEHEMLHAIMRSKRRDILYGSIRNYSWGLYHVTGNSAKGFKEKYHREMASAALGRLFRVWLDNGMEESPEELAAIMEGFTLS